jgi:two-component system KDP operon response regulator KdpE
MTNLLQILIIEDEPEIRKFLRVTLEQQGYSVAEAITGSDGLRRITTYPPELVILDLGLPDMDGTEIIKTIRGWSKIPIIVLSARDREQDKVMALEAGADDYLSKPFGTNELLARIKVALRHHAGANTNKEEAIFEYAGLKVDLSKRLVWVDANETHLTPIEYKLLAMLVKHAGKVVTHKQLLFEVWGKNAEGNSHYLRLHTQHLREKLGDDATQPKYILTEAGIGYRLRYE